MELTSQPGCGCKAAAPEQLVYALGQLGFDFGTEARRDSITQRMNAPAADVSPNPYDPDQLLAYLKENPWDAASLLWTLQSEATPIYVIQPLGPFAGDAYQRLRRFLEEQLGEGVERVSVPGVLIGQAKLLSGSLVPVIRPELRGMSNWTTAALVRAVCGDQPSSAEARGQEAHAQIVHGVQGFLERVYHEIRNLGLESADRAVNYAATNAFGVERIIESAIKDGMDLDTIQVERSPIGRTGSDCWDVKLTFFNPKKVLEHARKVYRFTVDVSDVVPTTSGKVRSWFVR